MESFLGNIPPSAWIGNIPLSGKFPRWDFSYNSVQCSAVQFSAVYCSAVQCGAVQFIAVHCSAVQFSAVQCSAVTAFEIEEGKKLFAGSVLKVN